MIAETTDGHTQPIPGDGWTLHRLGLAFDVPLTALDYEDDDSYQILTRPGERPALLTQVHHELLAARKNPYGLTLEQMAACPVLLELLGNGDPLTARRSLIHHIHELEAADQADMPIRAAAASLGLADQTKTHLDRLNNFGTEYGYEQRQVRRFSDKGLRELAATITTRPLNLARSNVDLFIHWDDTDPATPGWAIAAITHQHWFVHMEALQLSIGSHRNDQTTIPLETTAQRDKVWITTRYEPVFLTNLTATVVVTLRWPGELLPKYTTLIASDQAPGSIVTEAVGDRYGIVITQ